MDNSDDYFQDSFDLDENDLAVLAAEEAKYAESVCQMETRAPDSCPPQKRQKLSHNQMPEDILDVFLRPDGTYGVAAVLRQDEENEEPIPKSLYSTEGQTIARQVPTTGTAQRLKERSPQMTNKRTERRPTRKPSQMNFDATAERLESVIRNEESIELDHRVEEEFATLKVTVEMLKFENDKVKAALQDAETTRFAKEGEVTILRRKVEKAAQQHAEDIVKLKEAREAANAEQARIQKEMKQQIERVRTEYIFKQHETESSMRKSAWSSRSKRTALGTQMSPVPVPPAMRNWNTSHAASSSKSNVLMETPSRKRLSVDQQNYHRSKTGMRSRPGTTEMRFPGFENSFLPSSPLNSPSRFRRSCPAPGNASDLCTPKKWKGKDTGSGRAKNNVLSPIKIPALTLKPPAEPVFDEFQIDDSIQGFEGDVSFNDGSPRGRSKSLGAESSPNIDQPRLDSVGDALFLDDIDRNFHTEDGPFQGIDWSEELRYMLFSHVCPHSKGLTFHYLLCADIANQDYQQLCSAVLEALGMKYKFASLRELMEAVAEKLMKMAAILWESGKPKHLQALFELLSSIMTYIPSFTPAVLQSGSNQQYLTDRLIYTLTEIASKSLHVKDSHPDAGDCPTALVRATLAFIEAAAWTVPEELRPCLVPLVRSDRLLLTLLDSKQQSSVVSQLITVLIGLASHPLLFQSLLSSASEEIPRQTLKRDAQDTSRVPLIERLSSFLVDPGPLSESRGDEELSRILTFFFLLVIENPEGRSALLRSSSFIPCLVHYLTRLSAALWEEDEYVMDSSDRAKSVVQNMKQALCLLHRLVAPSQSNDDSSSLEFDFRQKLLYAPHSMFNGLAHMFVVMIGRLSYADPPEWLEGGLQAEIEKLTEPARDLMDLIIEGPEGDSVWVAYQDAEDGSVTENDDDMEAGMLEADGQN